MTDEAKKELKLILTDLMLWNNKHNNKRSLSVNVSDGGYFGYSIDIHNDYYHYIDGDSNKIDTWFVEDELVNM
jgi:hypothetical protein